VGRRFYRVVESPRFLERLETAEPSFIAVLLEHLYPILSAQPTGTTGDAPIVYERPFFSIELRGEGGWWGVVIYEVVEDELLVMLHDYLWERIDQDE
jgi:hypothetical protein